MAMLCKITWPYIPSNLSIYMARIRDEPDIDGPRTGEDLIRGSVFEADAEGVNGGSASMAGLMIYQSLLCQHDK